jgi:hypothetical protein
MDVDGGGQSVQSGGQSQVVTCSGAGKDGSLRVVRSGVGVDELASLALSGVKGMWSLRGQHKTSQVKGGGGGAMRDDDDDDSGASMPRGGGSGASSSSSDKYLVQSFIGETRVLGMAGESLEEVDVAGHFLEGETLYAGNLSTSGAADAALVVQVREREWEGGKFGSSARLGLYRGVSFVIEVLYNDVPFHGKSAEECVSGLMQHGVN